MLNEIEVGLICLSERKKFKEVYEEYFTALKYFAMRYVKDEEVACDLLQDVFVKLWEKGDRFENEMQLSVPGCPESLPDLYSGCPKERETYGGFRGGRDRGIVRTPDDRGRDLRFDK